MLWAVLAINAAMFLVEIGAGVAAGSASLQADALDFFGDAANYAISLFVVGMALRVSRAWPRSPRAPAWALFGLWVIGTVLWHAMHGTLPNAFTMGAVGFAGARRQRRLVRAALGLPRRRRQHAFGLDLHAQRRDRQSGGAAGGAGVFGTGTGWPDIVVAAIMAGLALQGAWMVIRQSLGELRQPVPAAAHR